MLAWRTLVIFTLVVVLLCVAVLLMKASVSQQYRKRVAVYEEQFRLQESIDVLQAEWALLTNPLRLENQAKSLGWAKIGDAQWLPLQTLAPPPTPKQGAPR